MVKKNSKIILSASLVLMIALALFMAYLYSALKKLSDESVQAKERIAVLDLQFANLKSFEASIQKSDREKKVIEKSFVGKDQLINFIEDLEEVGRESGVGVKVESASLATNPKDIGPSFHVLSAGNFSSVFKYSLLLENTPYEIAFEKMSIDKNGEGANAWTGDFVIKLLSYEF